MNKQKEFLFIQPPNVQGKMFNLPGTETPLSLLYLAGYLSQKGVASDVLDLTLKRDALNRLPELFEAYRPKIVGITAYTTNVTIASKIAGHVRAAFPDALIALGGFHASALPERSLEDFKDVDCIVYGEGEFTIAELAERAFGDGCFDSVLGLCYRKDGEIRKNPPRPLIQDLDGLPFPDREIVPLDKYVPDPGNYLFLPSTGILFSRGCPYHCAYCSKSVFLDSIRYRSEENLVEEIKLCIDRYRIRDFRFFDEGPTHSKKRLLGLCRKIMDEGLRISWNCYSRIDTIDEEMLATMKAAGCYHIKYGIESGVPETLKRIRKPLDLDRAIELCRATRRVGIECKANFILGFPWEGTREMERTIQYAKQCAPDLVTFNLFKPFPGSRLYQDLESSGKLLPRSWDDYFTTSETLLFETGISEDVYRNILKKAWISFYTRPRFIWQRLGRLWKYPGRELASAWVGIKFLAKNLAG